MRCALLGALTLGSASAGQGQEATVRDETFTAAFDGTPQQYVLQLPPKFDADARTTY